MPFFETITLADSIEINTTPERVFAFLTGIVDDESYKVWHEADHVGFIWLKGEPWQEGSVMRADEYLHGKLHRLKFEVTEVKPGRRIEYAPTSRLMRIFCPRNEFIMEPKGDACLFAATVTVRIGWIGKVFFKKAIDEGLASVRAHMQEEGENLKKILEAEQGRAGQV